MTWPTRTDYNEAIQNPHSCFRDPALKAGTVQRNARGLPKIWSGGFAAVYRVTEPDEKAWAVKCFIGASAGRAERYQAISAHLSGQGLPFVGFEYQPEGILVGDGWWPLVKMQWVEGQELNLFVEENLGKPGVLVRLADIWLKLDRRLHELEMAHGDLQHGNVLLVPGEKSLRVTLVDYDGMFVPALAGRGPTEKGQANYQHPGRGDAHFDPGVDRFSSLAIYTGLRALLAGGAGLWKEYNTKANLLFCEADFKAPEKSSLFHRLWKIPDPEVHALVGQLFLACRGLLETVPLLEEVVGERLTNEEERKIDRLLAGTAPAPRPKTTGTARSRSRPVTRRVVTRDNDLLAEREPATSDSTASSELKRMRTLSAADFSRGFTPPVALAAQIYLALVSILVIVLLVSVLAWMRDISRPWTTKENLQKPTTHDLGMKFALVPQGTFWMSRYGNNAQHQIRILRDFYLGIHEVTQEQWQVVMGNNPSYFSRQGGGKDKVRDISDQELKQFPVETISWEDAQKFITKLNEQEKGSGWLYRLPTEDEWEYSCRGASSSLTQCNFDFYLPLPTNDLSSHQANFNGKLRRTSKVGSYSPNQLGIYDLHGNVWEWTANAANRMALGGGWSNPAEFCRAASRGRFGPASSSSIGLRLARVSSGEK